MLLNKYGVKDNNLAMLLFYKSERKNSKTSKFINIFNLYESDEKILNQFVWILKDSLYYVKMYNHIEVSAGVMIKKESSFINANNKENLENESIYYKLERKTLSSFEQLINYIYIVLYVCCTLKTS